MQDRLFDQYQGIPLMHRVLLFFLYLLNMIIFNIICVLQQQVPLPLPCFNFAQITTLSLTPRVFRYLPESLLSNNPVGHIMLHLVER